MDIRYKKYGNRTKDKVLQRFTGSFKPKEISYDYAFGIIKKLVVDHEIEVLSHLINLNPERKPLKIKYTRHFNIYNLIRFTEQLDQILKSKDQTLTLKNFNEHYDRIIDLIYLIEFQNTTLLKQYAKYLATEVVSAGVIIDINKYLTLILGQHKCTKQFLEQFQEHINIEIKFTKIYGVIAYKDFGIDQLLNFTYIFSHNLKVCYFPKTEKIYIDGIERYLPSDLRKIIMQYFE